MHNRAMTLVELVLAISLTAVIGLAVAGVAFGISHAQASTESLTDSIQSGRTGIMRVDAQVRKARLVLATDSNTLSLWMGDLNGDLKLNLDEIVQVTFSNTGTNTNAVASAPRGTLQLRQLNFAGVSDGTKAALNVPKTLSDLSTTGKINALLNQTTYSSYLVTTTVATNVQSLSVVPDLAAPFARRVLLQVKLGGGDQQINLTDSAMMRADATGNVSLVASVPVLTLN